MKYSKGAPAPFFLSLCTSRLRDDALLNDAIGAFKSGYYADALIAVEYVCRRFPSKSAPAILRAKIIENSLPELKANAWYRTWHCEPENHALQDAMLHAWLSAGAHNSVIELGPAFLPSRCRSNLQDGLVNLLSHVGIKHVGACWKSGNFIEGKLFFPAPTNGTAHRAQLFVSNEKEQFQYNVPADGRLFRFEKPKTSGVWSLTFAVDSTHKTSFQLMNGSPLVFAAPQALTIANEAVSAKIESKAVRNVKASALKAISPTRPVAIILPVYRDKVLVKACVESVLISLPLNKTPTRLVIIDDASPESELSAWLDSLSHHKNITLIRNSQNLGFIEASNRGIRNYPECDALLLNADTLVHGDWIDRLSKLVHSAPDIASVTPWSNNGEISSFPKIAIPSRSPTREQLAEIDQITSILHQEGKIFDVEIPTCCGFAMLMRRDAIERIGCLDGVALIRGYGEEVDWCMRARASGYKHLMATNVFVAHTGTVSFRFEKTLRVRQNREVLAARYPDYAAEYARFINDDPIAFARKALYSALEGINSAWLKAAVHMIEGHSDLARHIPAPLASSCQRIAVWQHRLSSANAYKILVLARHLASNPDGKVRLLIIGEANEALWHTGVVDVLPSASSRESTLLTDAALVGLGNCLCILTENDKAIPMGIPHYLVDDSFDPIDWLINNFPATAHQYQDEKSPHQKDKLTA